MRQILLLKAILLAGCFTAGGGKMCIAGTQQSCGCPGGGWGIQVCKDDGSGFGACKSCTDTVDLGLEDDLAIDPCSDGSKDGDETDVDCGGTLCGKCPDGKMCVQFGDCTSGVCAKGVCSPAILCTPPTANCDGIPANGCNVNTDTDPLNCGMCGRGCGMVAPFCVKGVCTSLPPTCRLVNGIRWCYDRACGVACTQTCKDLGLPFTINDNDWYNAQNMQAQCQAIATAFGLPNNTALSGYSYGCLENESNGGDTDGGPLAGRIICSTNANCPMLLRNNMDQLGMPCMAGGRHAICPCQ